MSKYIEYFNQVSDAEGYCIAQVPFAGYINETNKAVLSQNFGMIEDGQRSTSNVCRYNSPNRLSTNPFKGCQIVQHIDLPNNDHVVLTNKPITTIQQYFTPSGLTAVSLPDSVKTIDPSAFLNCTTLTSVNMGKNIERIEESAFYGCSGLTSIELPDSVTVIGSNAFKGCGLESITIPENVGQVNALAFNGCPIKSIEWNAIDCNGVDNKRYVVFSSDVESITFGSKVSKIPAYLCYGKYKLTEVELPNSVTSIGNYAFYNCYSLSSITIPNNVTSIGHFAFSDCRALTSISIPNSVASIGNSAFKYCRSLTSITIPNNVTSIGTDTFFYCSSLSSITIHNSVTSIANSAFKHCAGLTTMIVDNGNITYDSRENCNAIIQTASNTLIAGCKNTIIPNSVTSIGNSAFQGCPGLTSITIPNSVTRIGDEAFMSSGLKSITCLATTPPTLGAYNSLSNVTAVYVPAESVEAYKTATNWSYYANKIQAIP